MKITIVLISILGVVYSANLPALQRTEIRDSSGQYAFAYLTPDGTAVSEQGALKLNADGTDHVIIVQGSYAYNAPDGRVINVRYVADENGFRAEGDHLPTSLVQSSIPI